MRFASRLVVWSTLLCASAVAAAGSLAAEAAPRAAESGARPGATEEGPILDEADDPLEMSPEMARGLGLEPLGDDEPASADGATDGKGSRRRGVVRIGKIKAKPGDTVRSVAYRYYTSPSLVAAINHIPFAKGADPLLSPGRTLQVPIARGSLSGFEGGDVLRRGPGVQCSEDTTRKWGRTHTVRLLRQAFAAVARKWPQRHPAIIGSLSKQGGGRLGRHKSHRSGQDIDVGYYTKEARRKDWGQPSLDEIDYERTWYLIDHLERTGHVAAVFMAPGIQRRLHAFAASRHVSASRLRMLFEYGPKGSSGGALIRHSPGHRDHMHIRLWIPADMRDVRDELGV